jgi:hypothetical protein
MWSRAMSFKNNGPGGCCCGCPGFIDNFENGIIWEVVDGVPAWTNRFKGLSGFPGPLIYSQFAKGDGWDQQGTIKDATYSEAGGVLNGDGGGRGVYAPSNCNGYFSPPADFPISIDWKQHSTIALTAQVKVDTGGICFGMGGIGFMFHSDGFAMPINKDRTCGGYQQEFNANNWFEVTFKYLSYDPRHLWLRQYYQSTEYPVGQFRIEAKDSSGSQNTVDYVGVIRHDLSANDSPLVFGGTDLLLEEPDFSIFYLESQFDSNREDKHYAYNAGSSFEDSPSQWSIADVEYSATNAIGFSPWNDLRKAWVTECYGGSDAQRRSQGAVVQCPEMSDYYFPTGYVLPFRDGGRPDQLGRPNVTVDVTGSNPNMTELISGVLDEGVDPINSFDGGTAIFDPLYSGIALNKNVDVLVPGGMTIYTFNWNKRWVGFKSPCMFVAVDRLTWTSGSDFALALTFHYWYCGQEGRREFGDFDFSSTDPDFAGALIRQSAPWAQPDPIVSAEEVWNAVGNLRFNLELV